MKKALVLLATIVAAALAFSACTPAVGSGGNGNTGTDENGNLVSLAGTVWTATEVDEDVNLNYTLSFTATSFSSVVSGMVGGYVYTDTPTTGTYTYVPPTVTLNAVDEEGNVIQEVGVVSGNQISFDEGEMVFTRTK